MEPTTRAPLAILPLTMLLRSLATATVSSSPVLLPPSLHVMAALAHSTSPLLNPDKNPLLRWFIKKSFYAQFCAGENAVEVRRKIAQLKGIGFTGVMLCYAREVVLTEKQSRDLSEGKAMEETEDCINTQIIPWMEGSLNSIRMAEKGDFVAIKFTGAGSLALYHLSKGLAPSPFLDQAIHSICKLAQERGVRLAIDAEQDSLQKSIDDWTMRYAQQYNTTPGVATVHCTYQAYKKCMPAIVSKHLATAQEKGFTLGVKLVRGAYLGSDPRHLFHDTKAETDACYDAIASSVLTRQWGDVVIGQGTFPDVQLIIASHNADSVQRARAICEAGGAKTEVAFAQLLGMADEVSCDLVEASRAAQEKSLSGAASLPVYKYLCWGTTGECMKYLHRRAQENRDAVQRTRGDRDAMWTELVRRTKSLFGLV
ncbi:proline dehydrogenase-like protein [Stachybotrys elegans]|uniref:Proline dehydrogenase n=1 Tax=Stachybotrys elegans TaxID=80388 RepID=A0A8K0STI4_9HYPO|nr:proline dehydrogenase-like protein [Stachybotrys elegans]